mgnify:CR=1 FL=1
MAGVQYAPVIRPGAPPDLSADSSAELAEGERADEVQRFTDAAATVAARLRERAGNASGAASEVLAATATLAQDRGWLGAAEKRIKDGAPAVGAVNAAIDQFVEMFTKMGGLMAERVTDLRDIRSRVVAELKGLPEPGVPVPEEPSILCAEDLAPADTAGLDPALVVALATTLGGPTSHTAIIARQLGINRSPASPGGLPVLEDEESGALPKHKSVPGQVERAAGALRGIVVGRKRPEKTEPGNSNRVEHRVESARQHEVAVTAAHHLQGRPDRLSAGGAGGYRRSS